MNGSALGYFPLKNRSWFGSLNRRALSVSYSSLRPTAKSHQSLGKYALGYFPAQLLLQALSWAQESNPNDTSKLGGSGQHSD